MAGGGSDSSSFAPALVEPPVLTLMALSGPQVLHGHPSGDHTPTLSLPGEWPPAALSPTCRPRVLTFPSYTTDHCPNPALTALPPASSPPGSPGDRPPARCVLPSPSSHQTLALRVPPAGVPSCPSSECDGDGGLEATSSVPWAGGRARATSGRAGGQRGGTGRGRGHLQCDPLGSLDLSKVFQY